MKESFWVPRAFLSVACLLIVLGQGCPTIPTGDDLGGEKKTSGEEDRPVTVPPADDVQQGIGVPPETEALEQEKTSEDGAIMEKEKEESGEEEAEMKERATYVPFSQAAYDQAVANGEPIFLFFYANWCPFCKEQEPRNQEVFASYGKFVRGFRVNYNDSDTDAAEKALAAKFKVTYQHTGIYLRNGKDEVKRTIGTESSDSLVANLNQIAK